MSTVKSITLSGKQLLDALSLIVGSLSPSLLATNDELETEINITRMEKWRDNEGGENPPGLYASLEEYPEEGLYGPLGETHEARKIAARAVDEDRSAALRSHAAASARRLAEEIAREFCYRTKQADCTFERLTALITARLAPLWQERNELHGWKQSQMAVEREWDVQAIAKLLGATPGQSCRKVIGDRVPDLIAQVARLCAKLDDQTLVSIRNGRERDEAQSALDALRQQLATAWLPMDSAPKNGDEILILFDSATVNVVRLCWWNDGSDLMNGMEARPSAVGWWFYQHSVTQEQVDLDLMKPLGWMPMPHRPQA